PHAVVGQRRQRLDRGREDVRRTRVVARGAPRADVLERGAALQPLPDQLGGLEQAFEKPTGVWERAASGKLPVLFTTGGRDDTQRAIEFAQRHELTGALYGASL